MNLEEMEGVPEEVYSKMNKLIESKITDRENDWLKEKIDLSQRIHILEENNFLIQQKANEYAAYVNERYEREVGKLEESTRETLEIYNESLAEDLSGLNLATTSHISDDYADKLDMYTRYVVEEFVRENSDLLHEHQDYHKMKRAISSLKEAFEGNDVFVSPDRGVKKLQEEIDIRRQEYNKVLSDYNAVKNELINLDYNNIYEEITTDLADTQKAKVRSLIEGMHFNDKSEYKKTLKLIVEEMEKPSSKSRMLTESGDYSQQRRTATYSDISNIKLPERVIPSEKERMHKYLNHL